MSTLPIDQVLLGHCFDVLKTFPDDSVDLISCDPPYGLGSKDPSPQDLDRYLKGEELDTHGDFMSMDWSIPSIPIWKECYRVLKPGRHIQAFAGTRTWDIIIAGMLSAGFVSEGSLAECFGTNILSWCYSSGFPKGVNISKEIDKLLGATREVVGTYRVGGNALTPTSEKGGTYVVGAPNSPSGELNITAPATEEAKKWEGWNVALKPAHEPIICLRKPGPDPGFPPPPVPFFYSSKINKKEADDGIDPLVHEVDKNGHPTRKPLSVMKWLVEMASHEGEVVLDPFAGSGATLIASILLGRKYIGIEKDPMYRTISLHRIEAAKKDTEAEARQMFRFMMESGE